MAASKRSARRARLPSLSDRIARKEAQRVPEPIFMTTEEWLATPSDDDCPICVAMRIYETVDPDLLNPSPDGGPPQVDPALFIPGARRALAKHKPAADEAITFFTHGSMHDDGTWLEAEFKVDGAGRVFWETASRRAQIAQMAVC